MAVEPSIMLALRGHLVAFAQPLSIPISFTNKAFTPPADGKYLRETFMPNGANRRFLGSDDPHRFIGLYQIDVMWPHGAGETDPLMLAGDIGDHFAVDLQLVSGAVTTRITKRPDVAMSLIEESRTMIPVSVQWESWT